MGWVTWRVLEHVSRHPSTTTTRSFSLIGSESVRLWNGVLGCAGESSRSSSVPSIPHFIRESNLFLGWGFYGAGVPDRSRVSLVPLSREIRSILITNYQSQVGTWNLIIIIIIIYDIPGLGRVYLTEYTNIQIPRAQTTSPAGSPLHSLKVTSNRPMQRSLIHLNSLNPALDFQPNCLRRQSPYV